MANQAQHSKSDKDSEINKVEDRLRKVNDLFILSAECALGIMEASVTNTKQLLSSIDTTSSFRDRSRNNFDSFVSATEKFIDQSLDVVEKSVKDLKELNRK